MKTIQSCRVRRGARTARPVRADRKPGRAWRAAAVAATLGCAAVAAHADSITDYVHLELGAGVTWYKPLGNGTWIQYGMKENLDLRAPMWTVGFTGPIYTREKWGVDWHVDYVNLGHVSSDCWCTQYDRDYDLKNRRAVSPNVPLAEFVGSGYAQGIALTLEPYYRYRGFRIGVEAGLFIYRPTWDETEIGYQDTPESAPISVSVHTSHAALYGKVIGVSIGRGPFRVAYKHYVLPTKFDDHHYPALWHGADVIEAKYVF